MLLPQGPASCARQGRSGLDQVGALVLGWGQLDSIQQLDWTEAWIVSRGVCGVLIFLAVRRGCCRRVQSMPGWDIFDELRSCLS